MRGLTPSVRSRTSPRSAVAARRLVVALALIGTFFTAYSAPQSASAAQAQGQVVRAAAANSAVTTYRADNARTGQYLNETTLTTSNVNVAEFGKRVTYPVDGQVYAQPLYLPNLTVGGSVHNVVFAATENDSVYAFDADQTSAVAPLWKASLLPGGAVPVPATVQPCGDLTPVNGITGTPAIDPTTNTMYVVAYTQENGNEVYRLHALDVTTGQDRSAPVVIQASAPGTGVGSAGGVVSFNPQTNRQRSAIVLANGKIYIAFSSFCDTGAYHGWILGYTYSGTAFTQSNVYTDTPNGSDGGIWGSDSALVADGAGSLYFMSGNGTFDANTGGPDVGDSFVRLNANLQRQDYFTPFNQLCLSQGDVDLGSGSPLLIAGSNALIGAGKEGRPYVVSTTNMGGYVADAALTCGSAEAKRTDIDKVQQELAPGTLGAMFSSPAYWNGPNGQFVYLPSNGTPTKAYSWIGGKLSATPTSQTAVTIGGEGGNPVVSSNGTAAGTGILWTLDGSTLRAYNAANLGTELYDSQQNVGRDALNGYVKFSAPAVGNGQVFVGSPSSVSVFGELGTAPPPPPPGNLQLNAGGPAVSPFVADNFFTGGVTTSTGNAVNTAGVTNPAPQAVYQSNRYGTFSYLVPGFTAGANLTVRLHFAETYWTTAGSRTFNVVINGQQVLTNFDMIAAAGAPNKAVVEQFTIPADSGGKISIQFTTVKDNAQVNGIEILTGAGPPPPPPPGKVQIDSGGPAVSPFVADTDFIGGTTAAVTNAINTAGVTNPAPQAVYQSNRFGNFSYVVPGLTAGASYTVRLHFAEEYWTAAGSRIFNVSINGQQVLTNFDIIGTTGAEFKAVVEQFTAAADSTGKMTIQFTTVKDNAQVNGVEILS